MSDKKNVLITGGVGFIGSNLAERLMKEGHNVFSIDYYSFEKKENEFDNIKYIKYDIENISSINESIDICYHLVPGLSPGGTTQNTL
jgi:UDP-glucose 4-epimerase